MVCCLKFPYDDFCIELVSIYLLYCTKVHTTSNSSTYLECLYVSHYTHTCPGWGLIEVHGFQYKSYEDPTNLENKLQRHQFLMDVKANKDTLKTLLNITKKRYMKCTFCLGLVGALYPSELELPVVSALVQVSPIFSAFL